MIVTRYTKNILDDQTQNIQINSYILKCDKSHDLCYCSGKGSKINLGVLNLTWREYGLTYFFISIISTEELNFIRGNHLQ